jgi:hypothetical protein
MDSVNQYEKPLLFPHLGCPFTDRRVRLRTGKRPGAAHGLTPKQYVSRLLIVPQFLQSPEVVLTGPGNSEIAPGDPLSIKLK